MQLTLQQWIRSVTLLSTFLAFADLLQVPIDAGRQIDAETRPRAYAGQFRQTFRAGERCQPEPVVVDEVDLLDFTRVCSCSIPRQAHRFRTATCGRLLLLRASPYYTR
uniref:(northern house mosquito) hypothetical protein n=1 Tax=Culex pipiens TaxID=7175 RepID=A0A8D8F4V1_CULPI